MLSEPRDVVWFDSQHVEGRYHRGIMESDAEKKRTYVSAAVFCLILSIFILLFPFLAMALALWIFRLVPTRGLGLLLFVVVGIAPVIVFVRLGQAVKRRVEEVERDAGEN